MTAGSQEYETDAAESDIEVNASEDETRDVVIQAFGLKRYYPIKGGPLKRKIGEVKAVDGVDLRVRRGETLGLVGESGCGKSTLARLLVKLDEPTAGHIYFDVPESVAEEIADLELSDESERSTAERKRLSELRKRYEINNLEGDRAKHFRRNAQFVFQNPTSSLNPRKLIRDAVSRPLRLHTELSAEEREERVIQLLDLVGLGEDYLYRYPHMLSGGQKQRVAIARAIATNPDLVVLDEPTSALDVSVQAEILNLLQDLQDEFGLTFLCISHDLGVIRHMARNINVMYLGEIVERASRERVFDDPKHPYTEALISSSPAIDTGEEIHLKGDVPEPENPPTGCRFHTRCHKVEAFCGWSGRDLLNLLAARATEDDTAADLYESLEESSHEGYVSEFTFEDDTDINRAEAALGGETVTLRPHQPTLFDAIEDVSVDGNVVRVSFRTVDPPALAEDDSGHEVACFLYENS